MKSRALLLVVLLAFVGCGEEVLRLLDGPPSPGDDGGATVDAAGVDQGAGTLDAAGEAAATCDGKRPVNAACAASDECCSGLCARDPSANITCRPTTGCVGAGGPCAFAGACCSLGCQNGACTSGVSCAQVGAPCTTPTDCCSNRCDQKKCATAGGGCRPAGETCGNDGECCGGVCLLGDVETPSRCALLQGCRSVGEVCARPEDCCSSSCRADPTGVLRCAALVDCVAGDTHPCTRQLGDVCKGNQDCCSRTCLPTGDGTRRCSGAGGCKMRCELCAADGECCSGSCADDGTGSRRCAPTGCGLGGEGCDKDPNCCGTAAGRCGSVATGVALKRCHVPAACHPSGICALSSDCCNGPCTIGDAATMCVSACVPDGSGCSARADCCGATSDCLRINGQLQCSPLIR